ncbi:hypothetical protein BDY21DRAFT_24429 [Lineolata rhizophorae]|uniref:Uncharacterized protein n=1 Tax=Lineolata rhizophorae TaxID=578093 RepID=A0A6A6P070_9PEZI|nr:hypothetical protein BDY21DRAFT_24429 [Lineolata rhizophorae]
MAGNVTPYGWRAVGGYQPPINQPAFYQPTWCIQSDNGIMRCYGIPPPPPPFYNGNPTPPANFGNPPNPPVTVPTPTAHNSSGGPYGVTGAGTGPRFPGNRLHGGLRAGFGLQYPPVFTHLHVCSFKKAPWEPTKAAIHAGLKFEFSVQKAPTDMTVKQLIRNLGGGDGHVITELIEVGDGRWAKGVEVRAKDAAAGKTLGQLGWSGLKGTDQAPVWVWVRKA